MRRLDRFLILAGLLGVLVACGFDPPPPSDPELREELGIPDHVPIHRVDLSGRGDEVRVIPTTIEARPGDLVQFVVLDRQVHLIGFREEEISTSALTFLRETSQDAFPPLVERGARIVLSFEGAPVGAYPFRVEGNGPPVDGVIRLVEP